MRTKRTLVSEALIGLSIAQCWLSCALMLIEVS